MYQVQITEVKRVEETNKVWQKLREAKGEDDMNYGYVQTKEEIDKNTVVFFQEVDELDLVSVIDAVNKVNKVQVPKDKK